MVFSFGRYLGFKKHYKCRKKRINVQIISKKYLLKKKEIKTNMVILWFLGARCTDGREIRE